LDGEKEKKIRCRAELYSVIFVRKEGLSFPTREGGSATELHKRVRGGGERGTILPCSAEIGKKKKGGGEFFSSESLARGRSTGKGEKKDANFSRRHRARKGEGGVAYSCEVAPLRGQKG